LYQSIKSTFIVIDTVMTYVKVVRKTVTTSTSGVHFSGIFSSESGESTEKHMSMTSVSGYDNGLSLYE